MGGPAPSALRGSRPRPAPGGAGPASWAPYLLLVLGMGAATHSVVRYRFGIVATYCLLACLLAWWVLRRDTGRVPAASAAGAPLASAAVLASAAALGLAALIHLGVPAYTYLRPGQAQLVRSLYALSALAAGGLLLAGAFPGRRPRPGLINAALAVAVTGYLLTAALLLHLDPAPKIDVWVMLQQSSEAIAHGRNIYTQNWTGSPGVRDAFTYLPLTGLLLAPGRLLAGDVRWMLVVLTLLGALAVRRLGGPAAAGAAALLLLLPGTSTQVEQAWTEPLLMACLAGWTLGVHRRNPALAVLCLALGLASKQHLFVLLPILAAWPRFGLRRSVLSGALAVGFMLPWIIASPKDIWHDTVTVLVHFQPLLFADTLYIAAIKELSWTPPFWLTGAAVLLTLSLATITVRRRNPDLPTVLRWGALLLLVANLVNKQAFYNQYWLVAAIVVISFGVLTPDDRSLPASAAAPT